MSINFRTAIFNFHNIKKNINDIEIFSLKLEDGIEYRAENVNLGPIKFNMKDFLYSTNLTDIVYFIKPKNIDEVENFDVTLDYFKLRKYSQENWCFFKTTVKKLFMILIKQINPNIDGIQLAITTNIFAKGYTPKTAAIMCGVDQYILENILSGRYESYANLDKKVIARALNFDEVEYEYIHDLAEEIINE